MKNGNEVAARVVDALKKLGVDYMMAGSFATNLYGIPRSTNDADFVAVMGKRIGELEAELGSEFEFDQPSFELVTGTFREKARVPSVPFEVELFQLSDDPHDQSRFARRMLIHDRAINREVHVPTVEDVIVMKLRWLKIACRDKDRDDLRNVLAVQEDADLDWTYIHRWCDEHGTRALLSELRSSI